MSLFGSDSFASRCDGADVRLVSREVGYGIAGADRRLAEDVWRDLGQKGRRPSFEKIILNVLSLSMVDGKIRISCGLMPYRYVVAGRYGKLSTVHPFAVTGMTGRVSKSEVLIGKRASSVLSHGGWYETCPSGGVELEDVRIDGFVDFFRRVGEECFEESGISQDKIVSREVFGFFHDAKTATLDLVISLFAEADQSVRSNTEEYEQLVWMTRGDVSALLASADNKFVDVSRWALMQWLSERE